MYELNIRTVPTVIDGCKSELLQIIDGWTIFEATGMWKGTEENSVHFTTVTDDLDVITAVKNIVNFEAWKQGEQSIMFNVSEKQWTFTNLEKFTAPIK
jgi:hypothetical protein